MSASLRRHARRAGLLLALLSCAYLAWLLWKSVTTPGAVAPQWPGVVQVLVALAASLAAMSAVALGWYVLLRGLVGRLSFKRTVSAFVLSQPAKYLPGNVLHFASRHVLLRGDGLDHGDLIAATVMESASLVTTGLILGSFSIGAWLAHGAWAGTAPLVMLAAGLLWSVALVWVLRRHRQRWRVVLWSTVAHLGCAASYFLCSALALEMLGGANLAALTSSQVLAAVALSWVAGYVVVGAPGGIGVREALLLAFLGAGTANAALLGAVLAQRLCMIAADLLLFVAAVMWKSVSSDSPVVDQNPS